MIIFMLNFSSLTRDFLMLNFKILTEIFNLNLKVSINFVKIQKISVKKSTRAQLLSLNRK